MDSPIFKEVDDYIRNWFAPEDAALKETITSLSAEGIPQISVSANQGKLLQLLIKITGAKKILELGTLGGYSTIWMARALPAGGKLISLEINAHHAAVAQKNIEKAGVSEQVEIRVGKALDILAEMVAGKEGPFDFIFIDADKPPYAEYFQYALQLSRKGSLIICDNVIRDGKVLDENTADESAKGAHRFNKLLSETKKVTATILQTVGAKEHDGIALVLVDG
jgi:predicted O-methyltransferase YrrM